MIEEFPGSNRGASLEARSDFKPLRGWAWAEFAIAFDDSGVFHMFTKSFIETPKF